LNGAIMDPKIIGWIGVKAFRMFTCKIKDLAGIDC
jgi:hypothetical protein